MKAYMFTILLALSIPVSEVHTFWERQPTLNTDWVIAREIVMPVQWWVKFTSDQLVFIMYMAAICVYRKNAINRTTAATFLIYAVGDTAMFFYNYKCYSYGVLYLFIILTWIIVYYWKPILNLIWLKFIK